jgi:hypothetical protein
VNRGSDTDIDRIVEVGPLSHEVCQSVAPDKLKAAPDVVRVECQDAREKPIDISLGLSAQFLGPGPAVIRVARGNQQFGRVSLRPELLDPLGHVGYRIVHEDHELAIHARRDFSDVDAGFSHLECDTDIEIAGCLPRRFHDR